VVTTKAKKECPRFRLWWVNVGNLGKYEVATLKGDKASIFFLIFLSSFFEENLCEKAKYVWEEEEWERMIGSRK